tara:strand:+ start:646 stop:1011 length:366 start_codon:yes stop_codon:yes gene_type:complete
MVTVNELRSAWESAGKEKEFDRRLSLMADVIVRQTDYDRTEATAHLCANGFSLEKTLLSYNGRDVTRAEAKLQEQPTSLNQGLFKEFRHFLDNACSNHRHKVDTSQKQVTEKKETTDQKPD